jgi:murein DD-endopeptidase MepM/ murein hydrolase activator NlpD
MFAIVAGSAMVLGSSAASAGVEPRHGSSPVVHEVVAKSKGVPPVGRAPAPGASWESVGMIADYDPPEVRWNAGHRGVDLRSSAGADVVAPVAGTVTFAGSVGGRPTLAISVGGGWRTTLEPVKTDLKKRDSVASGQKVGTVTSGGHCSGHCVHWGLVTGSGHGSTYRDPRTLVADLRPSVLYLDRNTPPR